MLNYAVYLLSARKYSIERFAKMAITKAEKLSLIKIDTNLSGKFTVDAIYIFDKAFGILDMPAFADNMDRLKEDRKKFTEFYREYLKHLTSSK